VFRDYGVKKVVISYRGKIKHATVTVNPAMKAKAIGKGSKNLKLARDTINRHHDVQSVNIV
jgi:N utilization substance protein A